MRAPADKYELAARLAIADLDDRRAHRLPAERQRELFGFAVFGRKEFRVDPDNQGEVTVFRRVIPGDTIFAVYSYAEVCAAAREGHVLEVR